MIAIVDGCGANISSVQFALARLGKCALLTTDPDHIKAASHVILPGVGTANHTMERLQKLKLVDVLRELKNPVLGICLGMQLLYETSAEGNVDCLGILPGKIENLPVGHGLTIPHMGWNLLQINGNPSRLMQGIDKKSYVYFVHSYAAPINENTIATTKHGIVFAAACNSENFYGVQFHPEKSGIIGEKILLNFLDLGHTS